MSCRRCLTRLGGQKNASEAAHWRVLGVHDAPDSVIMAFARENELVMLTGGLDFSTILAVTIGEKPSVVLIRARDDRPVVIGSVIIAALRRMDADLDESALLTINQVARVCVCCRCVLLIDAPARPQIDSEPTGDPRSHAVGAFARPPEVPKTACRLEQ